MSDRADVADLRVVADYQFGAGAGAALFPETGDFELRRTKSGRPRQVYDGDDRVVSYGVDGRFRLGVAGGRRLTETLDAPACRVVVGDESEPFVRDGKNVFAKFVQKVGNEIRQGDEVAVVHEEGAVLAVGRAELSASAMLDFESGMAVKVRDGAGEA